MGLLDQLNLKPLIGDPVEEFRHSLALAGMSQRALADAIDMHPSALSNALRGRRQLQLSEAIEIARVTGIGLKEVCEVFGIKDAKNAMMLSVAGHIESEWNILIHDDSTETENKAERVSLPFFGFDGYILKVVSNRLGPSFPNGSVIGISRHPSIRQHRAALVSFTDDMSGQTLCLQVVHTTGTDTVLSSLNPYEPATALRNVDWVRPVEFCVFHPVFEE